MGTLNQTNTDGRVITPNLIITIEGGIAVRVYNDTGAQLNKGYVVKASTLVDDAVVLTAINDIDPIGVIYENIPNGQWGYVVVAGIADVYVDNAGAVTRELWVGTSSTTVGQCTASPLPVPPNANTHFQEVGHTIRTRTGAGLVRCQIHLL